jgi:3-hydroxybutyryl-CoA dehydratase
MRRIIMPETLVTKGRTYDEFAIGERFRFRLPTVTEGYINNFCSLTGDLNPLHVDLEVAKKTIYGERIAPGTLTASLTFTAFAMLAFGTGMALLELNFKFLGPVKINDTLEVEIEILDKTPSRKYEGQGGIVHQRMITRNQKGAVVVEAIGKILVSKVPSYELLDK